MKYNGINRDIPVFMGFTTLRHARCISINANIQYISARQGTGHSCARQARIADGERLADLAQPAPRRGLAGSCLNDDVWIYCSCYFPG
jgi:hypothetical protein